MRHGNPVLRPAVHEVLTHAVPALVGAASVAILTVIGANPAAAQTPERAVDVVATRPGHLSGTVVDPQGEPLPGVRVRVFGPATLVTFTDEQGGFRLSALPSGEYAVRVYAAGYEAATEEVSLGGTGVDRGGDGREGAVSVLHFRLTAPDRRRDAPAAAERPRPEPRRAQGDRTQPDVLAAAIGGSTSARRDETGVSADDADREDGVAEDVVGEGSADESDDHGHDEVAWRLRRLERSPLKTVDLGGWTLPDDTPAALARGRFDGPIPASLQLASALPEHAMSGQVNLLTSGILQSPQDLFSTDLFSRNVTYMSLGAEAGAVGTWTVHGAMTNGDVSSWILAGFVTAPQSPDRSHDYTMGMSYAVQHYRGGNAAALAAVKDEARNAAEIYGFDRWDLSPDVTLDYGARYSRYDYLSEGGWLSPRVGLTVEPVSRVRVSARAARQMVAPGAEEFVPAVSGGLWLPPERTFSALDPTVGFQVERSNHYEVDVEHDLTPSMVVAFRAYTENVSDQLATLFAQGTDLSIDELGHYVVATAGDVETRGWAARVGRQFGPVRGEVEYSVIRAVWMPGETTSRLAEIAPAVVRPERDDFVDVTTSVEGAIEQTATRFFVLYRINSAFANANGPDVGGTRFGVQVNQALPFLNFSSAQWEMLLDVRNLFRDPSADGSVYDELLVFDPPKRVVGGVLVRF